MGATCGEGAEKEKVRGQVFCVKLRYETYLIPGETLIPGEGGRGQSPCPKEKKEKKIKQETKKRRKV